jgi:hypothetical protein
VPAIGIAGTDADHSAPITRFHTANRWPAGAVLAAYQYNANGLVSSAARYANADELILIPLGNTGIAKR